MIRILHVHPTLDIDLFYRYYISKCISLYYHLEILMKIRDFEARMKDFPAFNLNDVRKLEPGFHRQQLQDWLRRGYIRPLAAGYYLLAGQTLDEPTRFMLANRLYEPSYISLESALAYYQVIPETVPGVTSISARKTRQFLSDFGFFSYRSIQPQWMFGYQVVEVRPGRKFKMASLEKAVLDSLYLNPKIQSIEDFIELRWNQWELQSLKENTVLQQYLTFYGKQSLVERVGILMEYLNS